MGWKDRLFYQVRNTVNKYQKRSGRCYAAAQAARHFWAVGEENHEMILVIWGRAAEPVIASGTLTRAGVEPRWYDQSRALRLIWSGQHIGRKALPLLLHALHYMRCEQPPEQTAPEVRITVLGSGPETERWRAMATRLGINDSIVWAGSLPHQAALQEVALSDALVHTSVQEGTPHVVLEALSLGVPVICHDACGMSFAVNDTCGIKVPMTDPAASVAGFSSAIRRLSEEPGLIESLSEGAIIRAEELSWNRIALQFARQYSHTHASAS